MNKASGHESHHEKNPKQKKKRKKRKEQRVRGEKCWWRREVRRGQRRKIKGEKERIRVRVGKVILLIPISCTLCALGGRVHTELAPDCFFSLGLHLFGNTSSVQLHPEGILR